MSSTTWNGSSSTDWATGANWSTGSPPTTGAHVVIPDTSSINNCVLDQTRTIGSLTVQTNGTLVGGGFTLNITGEGDASGGTEGYAAEIDGHISGELNLISTKDGTTYLDLVCQSGNIHDLTINSSGGDYKILVGNTTLTGTLWIKDGNLKMNGDSDTLSVTEGIKLGNGSDAGFFGHNDHDGAITTGYLQLGTSGSTFISTEGTLTLTQDSTNALIYESISGSTFTNNDGTVLITGDGRVKQRAGTGNFHNVTLNASGNTIEQEADTTLDNTLTITAGEWHTGYDGYGYSNLTVGGHIFGNGTFKAFTSTVTVAGQVGVANVELTSGSITSNDDFRPTTKTTITGNGSITATGGSQMGGLFDIGASNTPTLQAGRLHSTLDIPSGNQGQSTFNLALNEDQTGPSRHLFFYNLTLDSEGTENNTLTMAGAITFTGNLTITDGIIDTSGSNHALTVTGKTTIGAGSGSASDAVLTCNDSTISLGSGSTSVTGLHVTVGGTFTGGTGPHTIGSILADNSAALSVTLTDDVTTINGKQYSSSSIFIATGGTFAHGGGTVKLTYAGTARVYMYNNKALNNFTVDNGGNTAEIYQDLTCAGNLTITAGTVNTMSSLNSALTVTGVTTIGDGTGGTPDEATLTCNASTCSFGSGVTADYGILVKANGTFAGGTGTHTAGGFYMDQNANAKATMTTDVMTINSEKTSANKCWRVEYGGDTFDNANGTVKFAFNGFDSRFSMRSESHANNAFHNLIIAMAADTRTLSIDNGTDVKVDNDLTISRGILNAGSNHNLEVVGYVDVGSASEVSNLKFSSSSTKTGTFGSLTIGADGTYEATSGTTTITNKASSYAVRNQGTFTANGGTLKITTGSNHLLKLGSSINNLTLESTTGSVSEYVNNTTIGGDLIINAGRLTHYSSIYSLDVNGDCTVNNTGILDGGSGPIELGSLTIPSGGEYRATTGTTTINGAGAGHSGQASALENQGTFTHNNGTILLSSAGDQDVEMDGTGNFYNLTINKTNNDVIMHPNVTIENNLDVTLAADHTLRPASTTNTVTVHGITSLTTGIIGGTTAYDGNHNWGTLQINSGTFTMGSGTNNVTAIRNIGGTIN